MSEPAEATSLKRCPVCGNSRFSTRRILWEELIHEWGLAPDEVDYIDLQQGLSCLDCSNNLRAMTLAAAILRTFDRVDTLQEFCHSDVPFRALRLLEINRAGELTPIFEALPNHMLRSFPEFDMQRMNFEDGSVDIVVHSDTLEHVPDPLAALRECRRILKSGGHLFYTVPIVIGRLTRSRADRPPSYHGAPGPGAEDYRVQTEYGADFWGQLFEAGFQNISLTSLIFPASVAVHAIK